MRPIQVILLFLGIFAVEVASALPPLTPEKEVSAVKPPIELILRLYQTRITANESLWGQIEIKNIGKRNIFLMEDLFYKPELMADKSSKPYGIYVEVLDAKGKPVMPGSGILKCGTSLLGRRSKSQLEEERKTIDRHAGWLRYLLTTEQLYGLLHYDSKDDTQRRERASWNTEVAPGDSRISRPWSRPNYDSDDEEVPTLPVGQFSELKYQFTPGRYTIRAVYDERISKVLQRIIKPTESDFLVRTKPIIVEVIK
jgi:hypothetical protein